MKAVTPAKAGVQNLCFSWIPAFAGMTEQGNFGFLGVHHQSFLISPGPYPICGLG